jgi:DNA invertase Pin-like site-specific DNA recombinase
MFNASAVMNADFIENVDWNTAIYVRISEEEKKKTITDSIENQKDILQQYAAVHRLNVYEVYEDDGIRGGSFNRPAFNRMIRDIEAGYINCVLVKDLSRFGREHIDADHYLERYFPQRGVRFISVIQGLDSVADPHRMNSIEVPMLNIFNEQYLRQVSNSTKASLMIKRKEGKFVGSIVPYGYKRDPKDKHHLVIDEEACTVVRDIFKWFLEYTSLNEIAERLNKRGILSPNAYRRNKSAKPLKTTCWTHMGIKGILTQPIYMGDMVQGKTYSYNCKVNKREPLPEEKWDITTDTHEAIIEKTAFRQAQSLLERKSKPKRTENKTIPSVFSGFLICKDCGKKMVRNTAYYTNELGERVAYNRYVCSTAKKYGTKVCSTHLIREDVLKEILLDVIDTLVSNVMNVAETISKAESGKLKKQIGILENQIYVNTQSIQKLSERISGLYGDYKDEIISLNEYKDMKARFADDKACLETQQASIREQIRSLETTGDVPCEAVRHYMRFRDIADIDRSVLTQLVEEIYVDGDKNISVNFKFRDEIRQYCAVFDD